MATGGKKDGKTGAKDNYKSIGDRKKEGIFSFFYSCPPGVPEKKGLFRIQFFQSEGPKQKNFRARGQQDGWEWDRKKDKRQDRTAKKKSKRKRGHEDKKVGGVSVALDLLRYILWKFKGYSVQVVITDDGCYPDVDF